MWFWTFAKKRAETYQLMLSNILELVGNDCALSVVNDNALSVVVCDFEQPIWKSLAALAPSVKRRGGQLQYRKAHNSKLCDLGLKAFYNGDVEFSELVHKVYALSYVPIEDVMNV